MKSMKVKRSFNELGLSRSHSVHARTTPMQPNVYVYLEKDNDICISIGATTDPVPVPTSRKQGLPLHWLFNYSVILHKPEAIEIYEAVGIAELVTWATMQMKEVISMTHAISHLTDEEFSKKPEIAAMAISTDAQGKHIYHKTIEGFKGGLQFDFCMYIPATMDQVSHWIDFYLRPCKAFMDLQQSMQVGKQTAPGGTMIN